MEGMITSLVSRLDTIQMPGALVATVLIGAVAWVIVTFIRSVFGE